MTGMATATDLVAVALPPGWAASQEAVGNASAVASAVAVAREFALRLLTSPAVERAEHHSGPRGEAAHVSGRSELCAVPLAREARRGPAGAARRIASRPVLSLGYFSLHEQREVTRAPKGSESPCFCRCLGRCAGKKQQPRQKLESTAFAPALQERATFLCSCKEKLAKRKHALPPRPTRCARRVHSAAGIFRRDIPVSSKNDVHPCTPPLSGSCPSAPSLRKGTRKVKSRSNSRSASSNLNIPRTPSIALQDLTASPKSF